ncbi:hypothetical protein GGTG_06458 [Gaeumannomyces tritici R3-111a-1]|uniref:Rhodopsin domain-containing protein n=1 Tax=Gaeumannomyces tritici (strain R3-111a-1) TaxID=644352 RepID=J3NYV6_GAET3|nr:hypothetical protein GGTG_06458 [Gaeumannomyces tritici R3-111a-1]EJT76539.1 hypothetical protein GGTG_06458 [Gaeumannomyces tritici R3-111a-1]
MMLLPPFRPCSILHLPSKPPDHLRFCPWGHGRNYHSDERPLRTATLCRPHTFGIQVKEVGIASLATAAAGGSRSRHARDNAKGDLDAEFVEMSKYRQVSIFANCRPFSGYWAMPPPNAQCATLQRYSVVQACFNISSDLLMLWVPIPLILKAMLLSIFSFGGFVIVAAVLTKVFNLSNVWDPQHMLWYMREASVAIYVANIPVLWPVLRDWCPCLRRLFAGGARVGESTLYRRKLGIFSSWSGSGGTTAVSRTAPGGAGESRRGFRSWPRTGCHSVMEHGMEMGLKDVGGGGGAAGGGSRGRGGSSSMERILAPLPPACLAPPLSPAEVLAFAGLNRSEVRALETKDRTLAEFPGGGFCASAIHVQRTVEVTAEDRDQDAALDGRRGGADIYNWEQNGASNHRVGVYAGR